MRLLIYPDLKSRKGIPYSRQHILRLEKVGKFPRRIQIGSNTVAWDEDEIDQHLAELKERRVAGAV